MLTPVTILNSGRVPVSRPAVQQAGPERAVVAAAGHGEIGHRRQRLAGVPAGAQDRLLALDRPHALLRHRPWIGVGVKAGVGEAERQGALGGDLRHGVPAFGDRAAGDAEAHVASKAAS